MSAIAVRAARPDDADAICRIYNQGIADRIATLETELRTPDERRAWMAARGPRHPIIVAVAMSRGASTGGGSEGAQSPPPSRLADAAVVGWGSLNSYNPRDAYRHVADFSVYVERDWRGKGVGRRLLERLIELARDLGYHKMMLSAFPFNAPGVELYERVGFTTVGICREMGQLDGKWVDTIIMEKLL